LANDLLICDNKKV